MPTDAEAISLPFQEAIDFFLQKARVPTAHWDDVWRAAHSHSFMIAGATSDALLADFQAEIAKALKEGTTLADFRKSFDEIVERHGWSYNGTPGWRSRVIYETNLSTAYSAGRYAQMTEPETLQAFPYWTYVHGDSQRPRPLHLGWNGLTLRADDPFWNTHYTPNGWGCSCSVAVTSARGLARMGKSGPDKAPPIETRPWRSRSGVVHQVPVGIDPGFDYNPGMAWKQGGKDIPVRAPDWRPVGRPPPIELPDGSHKPAPEGDDE
jgi:hypothetical protein